jgi:O-antigen ligase
MILGPPILWLALDRHRPPLMRAFYALCLLPIFANIAIIEVRAAFITTVLTGALIWRFRSGSRVAYVVFFCFLGVALAGVLQKLPEIDEMVTGRLTPVLLLDTSSDSSLQGRTEAIQEGIELAKRNWTLGIGPGGALTVHSQTSAHQFYVQQAMETGILGLLGCVMTTIGVLAVVMRTMRIGPGNPANRVCFALIIGPAGYVIYGVIANLTLSVGYVNAWAVIVSCLLGLATSADSLTEPLRRRRLAPLMASPMTDRLLAGVSPREVRS